MADANHFPASLLSFGLPRTGTPFCVFAGRSGLLHIGESQFDPARRFALPTGDSTGLPDTLDEFTKQLALQLIASPGRPTTGLYPRCRRSIANRYAIRSSVHATAAKSRPNHGKPGRCASTWNINTVSTKHAPSPARATLTMGSRKISTASAARRTACQATYADQPISVRVPRTRNCQIPIGGP